MSERDATDGIPQDCAIHCLSDARDDLHLSRAYLVFADQRFWLK